MKFTVKLTDDCCEARLAVVLAVSANDRKEEIYLSAALRELTREVRTNPYPGLRPAITYTHSRHPVATGF
ncbi:hypothetical protein GCM10009543_09950 [Leifsonia naganoensis]